MRVELSQLQDALALADVPDADKEHQLGHSVAFKNTFKVQVAALQTMIQKGKAHVRRIRLQHDLCKDQEVRAILALEDEVVDAAEARKKLFSAMSRGGETDLPSLFAACSAQDPSKFLTNHSVLSQVWDVELKELVRNSQMIGLMAQLHCSSARAAAIQAAHAADASCSNADDVATFIMEDPRT